MSQPRMMFTLHGLKQARDRCSLTLGEIKAIYYRNQTVLIGQDKHRLHHLFYSHPDHLFFTLIFDENTMEVITVLPVDYHRTCSFAISDEMMAEAKKLIDPEFGKAAPPPFKVGAEVMTPAGKRTTLPLGTWFGEDLDPENREGLLKKEAFVYEMKRRFTELVQNGEAVEVFNLQIIPKEGHSWHINFPLKAHP